MLFRNNGRVFQISCYVCSTSLNQESFSIIINTSLIRVLSKGQDRGIVKLKIIVACWSTFHTVHCKHNECTCN